MKLVSAPLRLALTCAFSLLLFTHLAYASTICSVDDQDAVTQPLSDLARNIQSLNQQLGGQIAAAGAVARVAPMTLPARTMLASRRDLVVQLIHENPSEVRAVMLNPELAAALTSADPSVALLIEKEATLEGELTSMVADDFEHQTSKTLYHLHTMTEDVALFPVSTSNLKHQLHQHLSASGIVLGGAMALETTSTATLSMTGEMASPLPATTSAADSAPACSTKGEQRIGLVIVKFTGGASYPAGLDQPAYWQNALFGANPSVNNYWKEVSYSQTSLSGDVLGTITLPANYGCSDYEALRIAALGSARSAFDLSKYNRIMITFPESTCTFGGLGYIGCSSADSYVSHEYSFTWIPVMTSYRTNYPIIWGNLAHELGHNLGLGHASTIEYRSKADNKNFLLGPIDTDSVVSGTVDGSGATTSSTFIRGSQSEYADKYSDMGNGWTSAGPYSAQHRSNILGWIPASNVRHVTANDTFTLAAAENSSGLRSARVLRDAASGSWLWLEYHQPAGYYTSANVSEFSGTDLTSGIQIHYENGYNGESEYTYLVDTSIPTYPTVSGSTVIGSDFLRHTLTAGQSFTDPFSQIKITAGAPTASGIPVTVAYETACATATVTPDVLSAAGGTGQINITADSSCTYSYSANAAWITLSGADSNNAASATGSRTITFSYAANTGAMRRNYIAVGRVSIPVTQSGAGGIAILPINPVSTFTTPDTAKTLSLTWDNSKGIGDNRSAALYMFDSGAGATCAVRALLSSSGTRASLSLRSAANGVFGTAIDAGTAGTLTSTACNVDTGASSISVSGNRTTLRISLTPNSAWTGARSIFAAVAGTTDQGTLNDGTFGVTGDAVGKITPTLTLSSSTAAAFAGDPVTLTAKISAAVGTPSGNISFLVGSTTIGTAPISGDTATLALTSLPIGTNAITASYAGNNDWNAVTSSATTVAVSDFTFTLPSNSITINAGATTGNTATINFTPVANSPAISITFTCSGAPTGASCSVNPSPLAIGSSPVSATVTINSTARPASSGSAALGLLALPLFGIPAIAYRRRLGRAIYIFAVLAMLGSGLGFLGCSSGSSSGGGGSTTPPTTGTPAGTSTLTITALASSGGATVTRTNTLTLTVR